MSGSPNRPDVWESTSDEQGPEVAIEILRAVKEIRFGSVEVVVHDGRVVQIERKEKFRIGLEGPARRK